MNLAEDLGSIPSIHIAAHNCLKTKNLVSGIFHALF